MAHFQTYGLEWKGEDALALKETSGWNGIVQTLAGWERDYERQVQMRDQFEMLTLSGQLESAIKAVQHGQEMVQQVGAEAAGRAGVLPDPQAVKMVQSFQGYVPPPDATELLIEQIWRARLQQAAPQAPPVPRGIPGGTPAQPPAALDPLLDAVLRMQAVTEAHQCLAQARAAAAAQGQAVVAAPASAQATSAGTEGVSSAPAQDQPQ